MCVCLCLSLAHLPHSHGQPAWCLEASEFATPGVTHYSKGCLLDFPSLKLAHRKGMATTEDQSNEVAMGTCVHPGVKLPSGPPTPQPREPRGGGRDQPQDRNRGLQPEAETKTGGLWGSLGGKKLRDLARWLVEQKLLRTHQGAQPSNHRRPHSGWGL